MKLRWSYNLKAILVLVPVVILSRLIEWLPWWSFILPVFLFGVLIGWRRWDIHCFTVGFFCGLIVWAGSNFYFDMKFHGAILEKTGSVMSLSSPIVILAAGVVGGLLTGLALYTGKSLVFAKPETD